MLEKLLQAAAITLLLGILAGVKTPKVPVTSSSLVQTVPSSFELSLR
jgi:hypothetical protein